MGYTERQIDRQINRMDFGSSFFGGGNATAKRRALRRLVDSKIQQKTSDERGWFGDRETVTEEEVDEIVEILRENPGTFSENDIQEVEEKLKEDA